MNSLSALASGVHERAGSWPFALGAFAVAVVVLLASYWQTVQSLTGIWIHDGTYQYAFLIFPLSLWVAFSLRHKLFANPPRPSIWGLLAVAALVGIWYVGRLLTINLPQHFALVALFPALVLAFWGWRAAWTLVFPLGYLVFAVPWGDAMVGPLQDITAHFAVSALKLTGTPVLMNGREIVTPSAVWMVADACSGVKFFIACTALGCLYSYLMYRRWWKRVLFVVLAAIVPVIANGLRVYFTILIGDTWGLKYATGTDHLIFGWQFFGTVLLILLLVGWLFRDTLSQPSRSPPRGGRVSAARLPVWPLAAAVLVIAPVWAAHVQQPDGPARILELEAPALSDWIGPQPAARDWQPVFVGANGAFHVVYQEHGDGRSVELFHAVYLGKSFKGHDLITYGNIVYDPAYFRVLSSATQRIRFDAMPSFKARELRLASVDGGRLVWYWYCVNGRCTDSAVLVKILQAWDVLRSRASASAVWAVSTASDQNDPVSARRAMRAFVHVLSASGAVFRPRVGAP